MRIPVVVNKVLAAVSGSVRASSRGPVGCHGCSGAVSGSESRPGFPCSPHPAGAPAVQRHEGSSGQRARSLHRAGGRSAENESGAAIPERGR